MPLIDLGSISSLLVCPRCRCGLIETEGSFRCSSPTCALGARDAFPIVAGSPAFVDFERSIVRRGELQTTLTQATPPGEGRWSSKRLPGWIRSFWSPRNRVASKNVDVLLSLLSGPSPLLLVIGGGRIGNGVDAIYTDRRLRVVGFDIYRSPLTQFIADAHHIPIASGSVDAVLIQAVLEHVLDPPRVVEEIQRVLRPGGLVYAETPFLQQVHAGPYDFVRYTSSGHRYLFRAFEEISAGAVAGPGTQLLWSLDHAVRGLLRSELAGKLARGLFFWLRYIDHLVPTPFAMDNASAYFFLGRRSDRELTTDEIVEYYRGAQQPALHKRPL